MSKTEYPKETEHDLIPSNKKHVKDQFPHKQREAQDNDENRIS